MLVVSSGSTGSAFLNNHTVTGGAILHYASVLPASLSGEMGALGPPPTANSTPFERDQYAVDAFLKIGVPRLDPSVTVMWLSGLDDTAHAEGVGAPKTMTILRQVDGEIARIQNSLRALGLLDTYDIWVTSDHGFSTHTGASDIGGILRPLTHQLPDDTPSIVTDGGAIYVRDGDERAISSIVANCRRRSVSARSLRRPRGPIRSTVACREPCPSMRSAGTIHARRRFCSRRTGPTDRTRMACEAPSSRQVRT
jgi:hypothetical protein